MGNIYYSKERGENELFEPLLKCDDTNEIYTLKIFILQIKNICTKKLVIKIIIIKKNWVHFKQRRFVATWDSTVFPLKKSKGKSCKICDVTHTNQLEALNSKNIKQN